MSFLGDLFSAKRPKEPQHAPSWEEIVEIMYDLQLDVFPGEVVRVIYSADKSKRYVVLKDKNSYLSYRFETVYKLDEDEYKQAKRVFPHNKALPAIWEPLGGTAEKSLFENEEELLKELKTEPEYKRYFE